MILVGVSARLIRASCPSDDSIASSTDHRSQPLFVPDSVKRSTDQIIARVQLEPLIEHMAKHHGHRSLDE